MWASELQQIQLHVVEGNKSSVSRHIRPLAQTKTRSPMTDGSNDGNDGIVELSAGNAGSAGISSVGLSLNRHVWHTAIPFSSLVVVKICRPLMDSNDESKLPFNS
jgi:hypothetical protein